MKQKGSKKPIVLIGTRIAERKDFQKWPQVMTLEKGLEKAKEMKITKYIECQISDLVRNQKMMTSENI